jgi:tetratricopeptide (TPR) repeat protein
MPSGNVSKDELMSRIAELEKKLEWDNAEAPPPVQAPQSEDFGLTPREVRKGFTRRIAERIVRMGFVSRIGEGADRYACKMNLRVIRDRRAIELLKRGLTEDQAGKQSGAELVQFATMWGRDLSSLVDIRWVAENFPIFTRWLDSMPPGEAEIMYLEEEFRRNPNDFKTAMALAGRYGQLHRYDKAEEWYRHALELDPYCAELYLGLSVTYGSQGRLDEAINLCKSAIELKPDYKAYLTLAVTLAMKSQYKESLPAFEEALKLKPDSVEGHFHLALAYVALADATHVLAEERILMRLDASRAKDLRKFIETLKP